MKVPTYTAGAVLALARPPLAARLWRVAGMGAVCRPAAGLCAESGAGYFFTVHCTEQWFWHSITCRRPGDALCRNDVNRTGAGPEVVGS